MHIFINVPLVNMVFCLESIMLHRGYSSMLIKIYFGR